MVVVGGGIDLGLRIGRRRRVFNGAAENGAAENGAVENGAVENGAVENGAVADPPRSTPPQRYNYPLIGTLFFGNGSRPCWPAAYPQVLTQVESS